MSDQMVKQDSQRRRLEQIPSFKDHLLRPWFRLCVFALSSTLLRLLIVVLLFPVYFLIQAVHVSKDAFVKSKLLLSSQGRARLVHLSALERQHQRRLAARQADGSYYFPAHDLVSAPRDLKAAGWLPRRETVLVCGAKVRVVHEKPAAALVSGYKIVLCHGRSSWSYVWRNIIPRLTRAGHDVFAVDFLGHGASDKPSNPSDITFELHMRTLIEVVKSFDLSQFYLAGHDWGGCVALCALPHLDRLHQCRGLFLLDAFFPPRPSDMSIQHSLLSSVWFLSNSTLSPLVSEQTVTRFTYPQMTSTVAAGYSAPTRGQSPAVQSGMTFLSHSVLGTPKSLLKFRKTALWMTFEGLIGPKRFSNINTQADLAHRSTAVRHWWRSSGKDFGLCLKTGLQTGLQGACSHSVPEQVMIMFGDDNALLKPFSDVLKDTIPSRIQVKALQRPLVHGGGSLLVEHSPERVAQAIKRLVSM